MLSNGKKVLTDIDAQLAALRQQGRAATRLPAAAASVTTNCGTSTTEQYSSTRANSGTSAPSSHQLPLPLVYRGVFQPQPAAATYRDPHETADLLQYLKRTKRELLSDFAEMEEVFSYSAQEEEERVERNRRWGDASLSIVYERPLNDPFVFVQHEESDVVACNDNRGNPASRSSSVQRSAAHRASSSSSAGGSFEALYDVGSALHAASSSARPVAARVSKASVDLRPAAVSESSAARSHRSSANSLAGYGSIVPSSSSVAAQRSVDMGLSTAGSVVPYSSVSVKQHIRKGLGSIAGAAHVSQVRYRPTCTVEVVHSGGVRFCQACGKCNVLQPSPCDGSAEAKQACCACGVCLFSRAISQAASSSEAIDQVALDALAEAEAREAMEFQRALAAWRRGDESIEDAPNAERPLLICAPEKETDRSTKRSLVSIPPGSTYFSFLWEQMQGVVS